MDKEEEDLFGDQFDEDDDLLNISLDELSADDEIDEPVNEEPDEDIIDLLDLVEKGDADLLGLGDDTDVPGEDDLLTEEPGEISGGDTGTLSVSDLEMDDNILDSDMSAPDDGSVPDADDLDQLLSDDSLDDSGVEAEETDITDDELAKLLDEAELEDLVDDTGFELDDTEDMDLQLEDLSIEDSDSDQGGLLDDDITAEPGPDGDQDDLFEGIGLEEITGEDILESDDELLDVLDDELEKSIVSSDGDSVEDLLWESDLQTEASDNEGQIETSDVNIDEIDDISLESESLEELLTEDAIREEAFEDEPDSGDIQELMADEDQVDTVDESPDEAMDAALENLESEENLFSEEDQESAPVEESLLSDDFPGDMAEEVSPDDLELPVTSDEDIGDDTEAQVTVEPDIAEASSLESVQTGEEIPAVIPQVPLISEEKIEVIVRDVVGEVVERIARDVFTEVAEKVITEAIDSLKKSLESDSE